VTLISWLGRYPALDKHAGNLGYLDLVSGVIVIVIFSGLIMWLAHSLRLRGGRVLEQLEAPEAGADEADAGLVQTRSPAAAELSD
ncbi:MAG: hypothetical protein ACREPZ_04960, partial [Rhodanobacteraceae bacterium]